MCLLLRIAGQESSDSALERTRSSNSFLHKIKSVKKNITAKDRFLFQPL